MTTCFLSGSREISRLPDAMRAEIRKTVRTPGMRFVVGDCYGADEMIQTELKALGARDVEVHHAGPRPRVHKCSEWKTVRTTSPSAAPGSREYHTAKDRTMTERADCGMAAVQNAARMSPGTKANRDRMARAGKPMQVFSLKAA